MVKKVWTGEVGNLFEKVAIRLLEDDGYILLEHTSEKSPLSPYDLIMEKDGVNLLVEVRGRRASNSDYFSFSKRKVKKLNSFSTRCIVVFINFDGYTILNLCDLDVDKQSVLINGIKIALTNPKNIKEITNEYFEELGFISKNKHENHKKKRLYARDSTSNSKQWERTELFLCDCGAVLEKVDKKKRVEIDAVEKKGVGGSE